MDPKRYLAAAVCLTLGSSASATIYLDRPTFEAVFPGLALQTFEGATDLQRNYGDFNLSSGAGGGTGVGTTTSGFPSRVAFQFFADDRIDIDFTIPVTAVGFQVAGVHFFPPQEGMGAQITAFDAGNVVLETITLQPTAGRSMNTFVGFANVGLIARVRVNDLPLEPAYTAIDNIAYGIPAPGSAALGVMLLALASRRRR